MSPHLRHALTYLAVAGACTALDLGTVALTRLLLDLPLLVAVGLGFGANVGSGLLLSRRHVFPGGRSRLSTASWRYAVLVVANVLVGVGAVTAVVAQGTSYLLARLGSSALLVAVNYAVMRWWVFDVRRAFTPPGRPPPGRAAPRSGQ
jgi:putative flippase GtrA